MFGVYEICCTFALANEKQRHSQLRWLERMIHNHEVDSSILSRATKAVATKVVTAFFIGLIVLCFCIFLKTAIGPFLLTASVTREGK